VIGSGVDEYSQANIDAVVFSRKTRALTRESFTMTDDFLRSNRIVPAA